MLEYLKLAIYFASFLYFPAAIWLGLRLGGKGARGKILAGAALAVLSVFAYARFVEPRILLTRSHDIALDQCFEQAGTARIVIFSDMHIGLFANAMPLWRVAKAVAAADPDAALIAGDFVYFLEPRRFEQAFGALEDIGAPVFAVLGNHDVGFPGPDIGAPLKVALERLNVADIDNAKRILPLGNDRGRIEIAGLSDSWQGRQDMRVLDADAPVPRILLTHNPLTAFDLPAGADVDLLVAGHTHGGQIYLPFLTCRTLAIACRPFREGLGRANGYLTFITAGTGMVGLPMRFLVPPRIDVLTVRYRACGDR